MKAAPFLFAVVSLFALQGSVEGRGAGVQSYLVSKDGKTVTSLGDTSNDLFDPSANVMYRYRAGKITAAAVDRPDKPLWTADAKPRMQGRSLLWRLLPDTVVVVGDEDITAFDRKGGSGKALYTTKVSKFVRNADLIRFEIQDDPKSTPALYLVDDRADVEGSTLAKFDLAAGKFVWQLAVETRDNVWFPPSTHSPLGTIQGDNASQKFYFDPATGKALREPLLPPRPSDPMPAKRSVNASHDSIALREEGGQELWTRTETGKKGTALVTEESVLIPLVSRRSKTQLLALKAKDGAELWRTPIPFTQFADQVQVRVEATKNGYLVHVNWLVLD